MIDIPLFVIITQLQLTCLNLGGNLLTSVPECLALLTDLTTLHLFRNQITILNEKVLCKYTTEMGHIHDYMIFRAPFSFSEETDSTESERKSPHNSTTVNQPAMQPASTQSQ